LYSPILDNLKYCPKIQISMNADIKFDKASNLQVRDKRALINDTDIGEAIGYFLNLQLNGHPTIKSDDLKPEWSELSPPISEVADHGLHFLPQSGIMDIAITANKIPLPKSSSRMVINRGSYYVITAPISSYKQME